MDYETLTDEEVQQKLDDAILKADPEKLSDDEIDRRLFLAENRHQSPDFSKLPLKAAQVAAEVMDYPMGIARSGIDAVSDMFTGKPALESAKKIGSAVAGDAISSQGLAQKFGIPDTTIPGTSIPQSAAAGFGLDMALGVPTMKAVGEGAKLLGKGVRKALNAEELALKATGTRSPDFKSMIINSPVDDPMREAREYSDFATKNFINPFNGTQKLLKKVGMKWEEAGRSIGALRKRNADIVTKWLETNPANTEVAQYVEKTFQPRRSLQRIFDEIDKEIKSARTAQAVKDQVTAELEPLHLKWQGKEVPIDEVSGLKTEWQNEVNFGKDQADYSIREAANNYLQREANRAIDNEFEFADKWMKGSDKAKHNKLKDEYGKLSRMYSNIAAKAAREGSEKSNILNSINPLNLTRLQTGIASIPNDPLSLVPGPKSIGAGLAAGASQGFNMLKGGSKEPQIGGFSVYQTREVGPPEAQKAEKDIQQSELSNTEKARRLNLLRKYGRILNDGY